MRNNRQKKVSLAGVVNDQTKKKNKKRRSVKPWIALGVVVVLIVAGIFGYYSFREPEGPVLEAEKMVTYTVTSEELSKKVSYFALGITGDKSSDCMEMVAVMCYNRKAGSLSVVQVPVSTYLGKDTNYAVTTVGNVWAKPQPISFCPNCRKNVPEEELKKKTHVPCDTKVESQTGSSSGDLCRLFNEQYGLPIDNFLVIPRAGLIELIDGLGGVDIEFSEKITLGGKKYKAGVHTLTGKAAVIYALDYDYDGSPSSDRERMLRQREVFAAILMRLSECRLKDLYGVDKNTGITQGVFGKLMLGENPVRYNSTSFGKSRLLAVSADKANKMKASEAIARFALEMGEISLDKVTCYILPGERAKSGSTTVYSVNKEQTINLLNEQMNPFGLNLDEYDVTVPEVVSNPSEADLETSTLADLAPEQTGSLNEED